VNKKGFYTYEASCLGKEPFDTWHLANSVIKRTSHKKPRYPYRCHYCGRYHISSHHHKPTIRKHDAESRNH